ncbi:MAG: glycerol-3-phosphate dehydrogenase/oxidase [Chitinophagaceae bacterium]|nr:glycerol-3-phosphate dehydrogenase/oxidase [Oligoflexus sp.]
MRSKIVAELTSQTFDVAIVGGGINGAVAAAALSAAGLKVALLEKKDFASSTSQESSNLIWGGIKYLESYEFGLVWELCRSRNELMKKYPSSVREIRFFTTIQKGFRKPRFLVFLGAVLYWLMGRFYTKAPRLLSCAAINRDEPIVETDNSQGGFEYSDCYLRDNDARFVFGFIRRAMRTGAQVLNYAEVISATKNETWSLQVKDHDGKATFGLEAKVFINAAGPYADALNQLVSVTTKHKHIFSKGVHLIVPRLTDNKRVLTFFADDGRLFFVIPMGSCTCIGTTDTPVERLPAVVTDEDRRFILDNINKRLRLKKTLTMADVISERCGVRPLVKEVGSATGAGDDWMNLSRKHVIETQTAKNHISVFGGKLTDCLNIGRELFADITKLGLKGQLRDDWFGESDHRAAFEREAEQLELGSIQVVGEGTLVDRLWRCYDTDAFEILKLIRGDKSLATAISPLSSVILAEFKHMADREMVSHFEDALRRRTRLALVVSHKALEASPELRKAAELLFGAQASMEWDKYFQSTPQAKLSGEHL